jgi:RNA polymerase sigma-70 factor, ECF subfamily
MKAKVLRLKDVTERSTGWSDEAVAAACAGGDPDAVAELFDRYQTQVTRFLTKVMGGSDEVEDLVQSTFLEIARGRAKFEGRSQVKTWIFGIAANVARHHKRSLFRRSRMTRSFELVSFVSKQDSEPFDVADAREQLDIVFRVLERFTFKRRAALIMCELEGLSAREAAQALGTTETAVYKQIARAREAILRAVEQGGS